MLSRAYLPHIDETDEFAQVNIADYVTIGDERLNKIKTEVDKDKTIQMLKNVRQNGWPSDKKNTTSS